MIVVNSPGNSFALFIDVNHNLSAMNQKVILLTWLLCYTLTAGYTQQAETNKYRLSLAPASPEAAMLFKFSDMPVSKYTGIPDINIPIKKLPVLPNGLDITLSYHASGIRTVDIPGYTGLGWSLQAGGIIARKTRGLPDDADIGKGFMKLRQGYTQEELAAANELNYQSLSTGCWDAEPDEFYFNVNGYTGKFSFDWSLTTNIQISAAFPVKIAYFQEIPNSSQITRWELQTPDGYVYTFAAIEQTVNRSSFTGLGTCRPGSYATTWFVTKIANNNDPQEYITFSYEGYFMGFDWVHVETKDFGDGQNNCGCPSLQGDQSQFSSNRIDLSGMRLKQIKCFPGNIQVDFIAVKDRQDMATLSPFGNINNKTLDTIRVSFNGSLVEQHALEYFYQGNRLMLKGIKKIAADGTQALPYKFSYNYMQLPERTSFNIDFWGYYNGKSNTTLLPFFVNSLGTNTYVFEGADRSTNITYAQAQILEKIIYPTGGSTELVYEGHTYGFVQNNTVAAQGLYELVQKTAYAGLIGDSVANGVWKTKTVDFEITGAKKLVDITIASATLSCQTGDGVFCAGGTYFPRGSISKYNPVTNQYEVIKGYTHPSSTPVGTNTVYQRDMYWPGKYRITVSVTKSPFNPPGAYDFIDFNVFWKDNDSSRPILQKPAGGLRIKEIRHYDNINTAPQVTIYQYTTGTSTVSSGVINGEPQYTDNTTRVSNCSTTPVSCSFTTLFGSNAIILGETNGSHIGYREVITTEPGNGKTVTRFWSAYETPDILNVEKPYGHPTSNEHRTGLVYNESIYDQTGSLVKKDSFEYVYSSTDIKTVKVQNVCPQCGTDIYILDRYKTWIEPARMGFSQVARQITYQDEVQLEKRSAYDSKLQLVKREVQSSGTTRYDSLITIYRHPGDEGQISGLTTEQLAAITKLKQQNRLSVLLEKQLYKNTSPVSQVRYNYKIWPDATVQMSNMMETTGSAALETRLQINKYDAYGNISEQNKMNDHKYSYLYDYLSTLIIAQVINADSADIACTSFEADGSGNWTIGATARNNTDAVTGKRSYSLVSGSISKAGLTAGKKYMLSYWSKSGAYTITGGSSTLRQGRTANGWTLYEHIVTASAVTITLTGSGLVDELRLYPFNAQMTSYTYNPLTGVTSECDANNRIVYYEYDKLGRLLLIRDQNRNIIKTFNYTVRGN